MKFQTSERKTNLDWIERNKETLITQYDGKYILVDKQSVIDSNTREEDLIKKAKEIGLNVESFVICTVGYAIPKEVDSGIWW